MARLCECAPCVAERADNMDRHRAWNPPRIDKRGRVHYAGRQFGTLDRDYHYDMGWKPSKTWRWIADESGHAYVGYRTRADALRAMIETTGYDWPSAA